MQRLGLDTRMDELTVVHVAGTKGKVSFSGPQALLEHQ